MVAATATPLEYVRTICPDCRGTRLTAKLFPGCSQCAQCWTPARFDTWIEAHDRGMVYHLLHGHWTPPRWLRWLSWLMPHGRYAYLWSVALPCGHEFKQLAWKPLTCATCRGVGTIGHWDLSAHYRERITPPTPRTSYRPARFPPVAPMHTPLLADAHASNRLYDWQRKQWWQH